VRAIVVLKSASSPRGTGLQRPILRIARVTSRCFLLVAASAFLLDRSTASAAAWLPDWLSQTARWISEAASPVVVLPMLSGVWIIQLLRAHARPSHRQHFGFVSLCCGLSALASSALIKNAIGRARPYVSNGLDLLRLKPFAFDDAFASMPSSQSAFAVAVSCSLASHFPRYRTLLMLLSLLVCTSRVVVGEHWASDVIAGWTIGHLVALAMLGHFADNNRVSVEANIDRDRFGLTPRR
jgi:undecaprenyl-diphosphatase